MSGWVRRLRQKLRSIKPALLLGIILFGIVIVSGGVWYFDQLSKGSNSSDAPIEVTSAMADQNVSVILQKIYRIGPAEEQFFTYNQEEKNKIFEEFKQYELISEQSDQIVYRTLIDDISPTLFENGYFSINKDGKLSIFEGDPDKEKILQTFFQIDIKRLESVLPSEEIQLLKQGIPFKSLAEYNSILSTYGEFAVIHDDENNVEEH